SSPTYSSASFADPDAGTAKPVSVAGISISGPDAGNYQLNSTASTTADIFRLGTTASLSLNASTAQYSDAVTYKVTPSPGAVLGGKTPATTVASYLGTQRVGAASLAADGGSLKGTVTAALLDPTGAGPTGQMCPGSHPVTAVFEGVNPNFAVDSPTPTALTI